MCFKYLKNLISLLILTFLNISDKFKMMKIHSITKTYKLFFRRAPYKKELVASLMDLATTKYNLKKNMAKSTALTLGIVGLVCYSTVKKKISCKPYRNRSLTRIALQSSTFKNILRFTSIPLYRNRLAVVDLPNFT